LKKGDFASMIKKPFMAGPFVKSFALMAKFKISPLGRGVPFNGWDLISFLISFLYIFSGYLFDLFCGHKFFLLSQKGGYMGRTLLALSLNTLWRVAPDLALHMRGGGS